MNDAHQLQRTLGMTRARFARLLGVPPGRLSHWYTGRHKPSKRSLAKLDAARQSLASIISDDYVCLCRMERCFNVPKRHLLAQALLLGVRVKAAQHNGVIVYAVPVAEHVDLLR